MYSNSERNYFDYATDSTTQMQKLVSDCRDWKNQCTDLTSKQIIRKYVEKIYNADKNNTTSDYGSLEYVMGLVRDILAITIEEDNKINNTAIELIFKEFQHSNSDAFKSDKVDELKRFCKNVIDTKRIKRNHEIISKRYNLKDLLRKEFMIGDPRERYYHTPFIFSVCRKLDTYNLELPEKINLMCEELAYLLDHEYRYAYITDRRDSEDANRYNSLKDIVPGVMTYILGTYSAEGIPSDTFDKVISAAAAKINNSSFFTANRIDRVNADYFNSIMDPSNNESFFARLARAQRTGEINTKQGLLNFIFSMNDLSDLYKLYYYVIYFYAISTSTFVNFNISLRKTLNALIKDHIEKNNSGKPISAQLYSLEEAFETTINFLKNLKPSNKYMEGEATDFKTRYQNVCDDLSKVCEDINEKIFYFKAKQKAQEDMSKKESVDVTDDTGLPLTLSNYEKKILASSEYMISRLNESVEDKQDFIDIITDKAIISHKEATDFLSKAIDECPDYFNLTKLKSALQETYKSISEDQSIESTYDRYIAMGEMSKIITKINQYNINKPIHDTIVDESYFANYDMDNLNITVTQILDTNISNYIIAETVHDVVGIPVHEMKISSYARMVLDKFRQGYDYLNDKQKAVFDTLDRLADRFSHFDDKEARAEARMQVIKGQMLPPLSKCLKTILLAGLIAIINPWLGLLAIIVKYVTSKNATKEERQAVCDELEVEIQMIDRKIQDAVDEKDYKLERKLRLLKKKMLVQYSKISFDNMVKWDNSLYMKSQTDEAGQKIGLKED